MDRFTKFLLGLAIILMIAELTYINTKSLIFIINKQLLIDKIFAVIGALAFSIVTLLIMRNSLIVWVKRIFPFFDIALVFFGLNVGHANNLLDDKVRFFLTVFMSLFSGLILYSLGVINFKSSNTNESKAKDELKERCNNLGRKLDETRADLNQSHAELQQSHDDLLQKESELIENEKMLQQSQGELTEATNKLEYLEMELQQYRLACTCPHCEEIFESEAAKRSHAGRCKQKVA